MDVLERIEKGEAHCHVRHMVLGCMYEDKSLSNELIELAKLGHRMQWVSVADRLPRKDDVVLVWVGTVWVRACLGKTPYGQAWYLVDRNSYINIHNVTHWMPLPPYPKEAE